MQGACVGARHGAKERVAVAVAVAALLVGPPDSGDAQAGGVSPPFTVCARSWFEVWGGVWGSEGEGVDCGRESEDQGGVKESEGREWAGGRERVE